MKISKASMTIGEDCYEWTDFSRTRSIETSMLLRCVAVVAYSSRRRAGSIAHLTVKSNVERYVAWLKKLFNPVKTQITLIGGDTPRDLDLSYFIINGHDEQDSYLQSQHHERNPQHRGSEDIIMDLERELGKRKFKIKCRELYGKKVRNVVLHENGQITVKSIPEKDFDREYGRKVWKRLTLR